MLTISLKWGIWLEHPLKLYQFNVVTEVLVNIRSKERERKAYGFQRGKEAVIIHSWCYVQNKRDPTKKILKVIKEFYRNTGYELSIQKCKFWYNCHEESGNTMIKRYTIASELSGT